MHQLGGVSSYVRDSGVIYVKGEEYGIVEHAVGRTQKGTGASAHNTGYVKTREFPRMPSQSEMAAFEGTFNPNVNINGEEYQVRKNSVTGEFYAQPSDEGHKRTMQQGNVKHVIQQQASSLVQQGVLTQQELTYILNNWGLVAQSAVGSRVLSSIFYGSDKFRTLQMKPGAKEFITNLLKSNKKEFLHNKTPEQIQQAQDEYDENAYYENQDKTIKQYNVDKYGRHIVQYGNNPSYVVDLHYNEDSKSFSMEFVLGEDGEKVISQADYETTEFVHKNVKKGAVDWGGWDVPAMSYKDSGLHVRDIYGNELTGECPVQGLGGKGKMYTARKTVNGKTVFYYTVIDREDQAELEEGGFQVGETYSTFERGGRSVGDYLTTAGVTAWRLANMDVIGVGYDAFTGKLVDSSLNYDWDDAGMDAAITAGTAGLGHAAARAGKLTKRAKSAKRARSSTAFTKRSYVANKTSSRGYEVLKKLGKLSDKTTGGGKRLYGRMKGARAAGISYTNRAKKRAYQAMKTSDDLADDAAKASKPQKDTYGFVNDTQKVRPVDETGELVTKTEVKSADEVGQLKDAGEWDSIFSSNTNQNVFVNKGIPKTPALPKPPPFKPKTQPRYIPEPTVSDRFLKKTLRDPAAWKKGKLYTSRMNVAKGIANAGGQALGEMVGAFDDPYGWLAEQGQDAIFGSGDSDDEVNSHYNPHNRRLTYHKPRISNTDGNRSKQKFWAPRGEYERRKREKLRRRMSVPPRRPRKIKPRMCPEGYRYDRQLRTCVPDEKYLIFN
jgi:hypothetical protein